MFRRYYVASRSPAAGKRKRYNGSIYLSSTTDIWDEWGGIVTKGVREKEYVSTTSWLYSTGQCKAAQIWPFAACQYC